MDVPNVNRTEYQLVNSELDSRGYSEEKESEKLMQDEQIVYSRRRFPQLDDQRRYLEGRRQGPRL